MPSRLYICPLDEMKQLGISGSEEIIDAGNPKNRERIKALLEE